MAQGAKLTTSVFMTVYVSFCAAGGLLPADTQSIEFRDVASHVGLDEPLAGMMAHAAAWGDIDGDGDLDLYVAGFCDRPDEEYRPAPGPVPARLLRNHSAGRFERVASAALESCGRTSDALFVDLNNDRQTDLYVANNTRRAPTLASGVQRDAQLRRSALYRNDRGSFVDVSAVAGTCLTAPGSTRSIGALDYDADGLLDLMVVDDRFGPPARTRLCRNLGGFRFQDVTVAVGLPADLFGLDVAIADLNADHRPDLFVSHSNRFFLSAGGRYVEPPGLKRTFAWQPLDAEDWPAGAAFGDLNRDGRLDLVVGIHHERARNRVYLNEGLVDGVPRFQDVSDEVGIPARLTNKSPHVEIQDFDNDGWPDLYFATGWLEEDGSITPLVLRNRGAKNGRPHFDSPRPILEAAPLVYFPAGPSGDYDGDGRLDVLLANWFPSNRSRLLKNVSGKHRWLDVTVLGRTINHQGIGTAVRIYRAGEMGNAAARLGFQEIGAGQGFGSGQAPVAHFGVAGQASVDLELVFPDGSRAFRHHVATGQRVAVQGP
jgi:hypothetical protein